MSTTSPATARHHQGPYSLIFIYVPAATKVAFRVSPMRVRVSPMQVTTPLPFGPSARGIWCPPMSPMQVSPTHVRVSLMQP